MGCSYNALADNGRLLHNPQSIPSLSMTNVTIANITLVVLINKKTNVFQSCHKTWGIDDSKTFARWKWKDWKLICCTCVGNNINRLSLNQALSQPMYWCSPLFFNKLLLLSDPSPIIGYACQWLTNWLTNSLLFSKLEWCDPGVWRYQLKTCWYCWWWGLYWQQFVADLVAEDCS